MDGIKIIMKYTIRLLLRNKGFLCLLILVPMLSVLLLNIQSNTDTDIKTDANQVYQMKNIKEQICYSVKMTQCPIKVYDSTENGLGRNIAEELAKVGIFQVFYCDSSKCKNEEIKKDIDRSRENDKLVCILELRKTLEKELRAGKLSEGANLYVSEEKKQTQLIEQTLSGILSSYSTIAQGIPADQNLVDAIEKVNDTQPKMNEVSVDMKEEGKLDWKQRAEQRRIGYVFAIVTMCFIFSGIMISDTVFKERQYHIFSRIQLTDLTNAQYMIAKYIVALMTDVIQTAIIGIAMSIMVTVKYSVSKPELLLNILILGLIFNTLSFCIGIMCNNVMNANYIAFTLWSVTDLLSGCYFELTSAGTIMKRISNLMPQKWSLEYTKMSILGESGGIRMLLIAAAAFMIIIASLGILAVKQTGKE